MFTFFEIIDLFSFFTRVYTTNAFTNNEGMFAHEILLVSHVLWLTCSPVTLYANQPITFFLRKMCTIYASP